MFFVNRFSLEKKFISKIFALGFDFRLIFFQKEMRSIKANQEEKNFFHNM